MAIDSGQRLILADTSVWVEHDRATESAADHRLTDLIASADLLATTEPVIMEVLAGARNAEREHELRRLLGRAFLLPMETPTDFDGAVRIYRRCRRAGITPRGLIDCMIASVASRTGASLLAHDADLARVARVIGVELDSASLGAT